MSQLDDILRVKLELVHNPPGMNTTILHFNDSVKAEIKQMLIAYAEVNKEHDGQSYLLDYTDFKNWVGEL
jgi:hypothetical protein